MRWSVSFEPTRGSTSANRTVTLRSTSILQMTPPTRWESSTAWRLNSSIPSSTRPTGLPVPGGEWSTATAARASRSFRSFGLRQNNPPKASWAIRRATSSVSSVPSSTASTSVSIQVSISAHWSGPPSNIATRSARSRTSRRSFSKCSRSLGKPVRRPGPLSPSNRSASTSAATLFPRATLAARSAAALAVPTCVESIHVGVRLPCKSAGLRRVHGTPRLDDQDATSDSPTLPEQDDTASTLGG